eukprot:UN01667
MAFGFLLHSSKAKPRLSIPSASMLTITLCLRGATDSIVILQRSHKFKASTMSDKVYPNKFASFKILSESRKTIFFLPT